MKGTFWKASHWHFHNASNYFERFLYFYIFMQKNGGWFQSKPAISIKSPNISVNNFSFWNMKTRDKNTVLTVDGIIFDMWQQQRLRHFDRPEAHYFTLLCYCVLGMVQWPFSALNQKASQFFLFKCHSKFYTLSRQTLLFFETINFCQSKLFLCDFSISKFCSAGGTCIHTHVTSIVVTMEKVVWCAAFSAIFSLFPIVLFRQCRTDRQSQTCSWMAIRGQCDWCWGVFLGTVFSSSYSTKKHTSLLMSHFLLLWCGF